MEDIKDIEDFTNLELYEEGQKVIREMQNRGLTPQEVLNKLEVSNTLEEDLINLCEDNEVMKEAIRDYFK